MDINIRMIIFGYIGKKLLIKPNDQKGKKFEIFKDPVS